MLSLLALSPCSFLAVLAPALQTKFGAAVSLSDVNGDGFDDVIVGEPLYDGTFEDEGRVLVYHGSAAGPGATPAWTRRGFQAHAHLGATVAGVGDVNGDGYGDVVVGAPEFDAPRPSRLDGPGAAQSTTALRNAGAIALFLGSPGGLSLAPGLARFGPEPDEFFGRTLSRAGDVNGDGFDDVVVGAPDAGVERTGTAKAYFGSAHGLTPFPQWSLGFPAGGGDGTDDDGNSDWGAVVCVAGDQNGDGFGEVLVSNPTYNAAGGAGSGPLFDVGLVRLFRGSASTLQATTVQWGPSDDSYLRGRALAAVGDANGDGRADVTLADVGGYPSCTYGSTTGFWGTSTILVPASSSELALSSAGDVDGDGFDDVLTGAPSATGPSKVQIHRGSPAGISTTATWTILEP